MYQLRNLVHRTNVPKDPEKNMDSAEDFMLLMLHTHVVAAAKVILDLQPVETVQDLAKMIIVNFVRLPNVSTSTMELEVQLQAVVLLMLMVSMFMPPMVFVKGMGTGFYVTGKYYSSFLNGQIIETMQKKL